MTVTPEQAFGILAAAHAESVVENRLLRVQISTLEAQVKALTPPPEGESKLEVVK
jgi:hypothetical protein